MNDPVLADPDFERGVQATLRAMRIQDEARERFAAEARSAPATPAQVELERLCRQARTLALVCWLLALFCIGTVVWSVWRSKQPRALTPRPQQLPQSSSGTRSTSCVDRQGSLAWCATGCHPLAGSLVGLSTALAACGEATPALSSVNSKGVAA